MRGSSFFETKLGVSRTEFQEMPRERASALVRSRLPDLLYFLRQGLAPREADEPRRTLELASGLETALVRDRQANDLELQNLRDRIITDGFMRTELDRDQNVYLGPFFTRVLTQAAPDLVFQPTNPDEVERALVWAHQSGVGIATRGAGSTAMGGSVPNDGGLLLELSRFDQIQVDREDQVAVIGAGARMKQVHEKLAAEGVALKTYPSNLGGTLAGWFCAGGLGLNSFRHGPVQNQVRALSMVLPKGEHVRFHDDGRLDVLEPETHRFDSEEAEVWMHKHGYPALRIEDLAQTEGQLGIILTLNMSVQALPRLVPFYFEFENDANAFGFVLSIGEKKLTPANLKYLSASHVGAVRTLRGEPANEAKPAVYLDFEDPETADAFEASLDVSRWGARRDDAQARAWFGDRFRPQQTKRLGPGFLAAEILLPSGQVEAFGKAANQLASRVGIHLETEVYFFSDERALALPGYLSAGPRRGFMFELLLAPMLVDLAMKRFGGTPYVLGRWQSPYFGRKHARHAKKKLRRAKKKLDPAGILNPGVFYGPVFRVPGIHGVFRTTFPSAVRVLRWVYGSPLFAPLVRRCIGAQDTVVREPSTRETVADQEGRRMASDLENWTPTGLAREARSCVNCGECNSVCPIFHDSKIRLPQMLTHMGEQLGQEGQIQGTEQLLLDLCMRCGNCQEVCQADIPHLDLYAGLEQRAGDPDEERNERHVALLAHLRSSDRYMREFLDVRPGGYLQRIPASLPGEMRFALLRAENDAGPSDTCIHCGACVPVCPTNANHEFEDESDPRRITTELDLCIGCGTCVEVCPANLQNGGQTLRVMEAPTREFHEIVAGLESAPGPKPRAESV